MKLKKLAIGNLNPKFFRVSIFGSSRVKKDDKVYRQVHRLAEMLGERGIDVVTGGGPGLMNAANSGHKVGSVGTEAKSFGLGIKLPKEQKYNKNIDVRKTFEMFSSRLDKFMLVSNAVVVAPGGVGTLLEFFYTWQLVQVKHVCHIPIILMGEPWPELIKWLRKWPLRKRYFDKKDLDMIFWAKDYRQAIEVIDEAYKEFKKGKKDFCLNFKKYRIN